MNHSSLSKNPSLVHHDVLQKVCSPIRQLGINFFGYTAVDSIGNAYCLGSNVDYAEQYLLQNGAQSDVHYHHESARTDYEYLFWDFLEKDENTEKLYQMAAEFDQSHTLTISNQEDKLNHCYHFSAPLHQETMNQIYLEKLDVLHAFIDYFKDCLVNIPELAAVYSTPVNIKNQELGKYEQTSIIKADPRQVNLANHAAKRVKLDNSDLYFLTKNERNTLKWMQLGKSAELIARIHGVSRKTIERHVAAIKDKFNCYTLYQLGEKVATAGLTPFLALR